MNNRLSQLFGRKSADILSIYFTAGFPRLDSSVDIMLALQDAGVDMAEVGVPFSDPMADGPTIQHSSSVALRNGMKLGLCLDQVAEARAAGVTMPLVLMGYLNQMMAFGIERLFERCAAVGIDALIVPDLPLDEYMAEWHDLCRRYDIPVVMLITPETSAERIRLIDEHTIDGSFIYMVSTASTTGARNSFGPAQTDYFSRIAAMGLSHPRLIGFGISNRATLSDACAYSSGAIIGSAFIKALEATPTPRAAVAALLDDLTR